MSGMAVAQRMTVAEYLELDEQRRTWLVDELARGDALTSPLLPGFALPVETVFAA